MVDVREGDAELLGALPADGGDRVIGIQQPRGRLDESPPTPASSEKIGTASPYRVLPWGQITGVITDAAPTDEVIKQLSALDVEILHAGAVF